MLFKFLFSQTKKYVSVKQNNLSVFSMFQRNTFILIMCLKCSYPWIMFTEGGTHAVSPRLLACFSTLYLFCKVRPELLEPHVCTIQPYLDIKCSVSEIQSIVVFHIYQFISNYLYVCFIHYLSR